MSDERVARFHTRLMLFVGIVAGAMLGWWFLLAYTVLWVGIAVYERASVAGKET